MTEPLSESFPPVQYSSCNQKIKVVYSRVKWRLDPFLLPYAAGRERDRESEK